MMSELIYETLEIIQYKLLTLNLKSQLNKKKAK